MASSGTYSIDFEIDEIVTEAWERCGRDPSEMVARHARSARRSMNFMFSEWANKGVRLFSIDEQTQTLTASDVDYAAASGTLAILECVIRRDGVDTPVHKISRESYHMIPNKTQTGLPTQLYFDRKTGTYYLWNAPENSTDVLRYYRWRRIQDVTAASETLDLPYRWFEAVAAGLAAKLAVKFSPDRAAVLNGLAKERFVEAGGEDRERTDTSVSLSF